MNTQVPGLAIDLNTGTISATTPEAIDVVRGVVIASAAALYLNTGMKANRAYTPTAMRKALNGITGVEAKTLRAALIAYVAKCEQVGRPCTNPQVLRAIAP